MSVLRILTVTQDPNRFGVALPRPVFIVADFRATCPRCHKTPHGIGLSKKKARRAMVRLRSCGCRCV